MTSTPISYPHPFLSASAAGDVERMEQMLLANPAAAAEARDDLGNSAAHVAARHGRVQALALLARHEPGLIHARNNVRNGPVHAAAEAGEVEALQWFFEQVAVHTYIYIPPHHQHHHHTHKHVYMHACMQFFFGTRTRVDICVDRLTHAFAPIHAESDWPTSRVCQRLRFYDSGRKRRKPLADGGPGSTGSGLALA
jgi:hypothetical protein